MNEARSVVIFRADGHAEMGLGHLVRSCTLADMLAPEFECFLAYRHGEPSVWAGNNGLREAFLLSGPEEEEVNELITLANALNPGSAQNNVKVVLDGYGFDLAYQAALKTEGFGVVFIDDIQHCPFVADLVINHAPSARADLYELEAYTNTAFGLRFALLRPVFFARPALADHSTDNGPVFLCLGGADPANQSIDVLRFMVEQKIDRAVDLVIGAAYLHQEALTEYLSGTDQLIRVHQNISSAEMADLMWHSAVGVTSPSTVSLEYLATGKQLYLCQTAANQNAIQAALLSRKLARPLSDLVAAASYPPNAQAARLFDGNQGLRLRKLFKALDLDFRVARYDDCRLLYDWATDEQVRAQSFNSAAINWRDHKAWFIAQLANPDHLFLICEDESGPVGLVRFMLSGEQATLGYSLCAAARGKGYGVGMVHFATERLKRLVPAIKVITAFVKKGNTASLITLTRLGYDKVETDIYPDVVNFTLNV